VPILKDLYTTDTAALFDGKAVGWSSKYKSALQDRLKIFTKFVLRFLPYGSRVLDFGSGSGVFLEHLSKAGYTCVGIDISAAMVSQARLLMKQKGCNVQIINGTLEDLNDNFGKFDGILCSSVLEYIADLELTLTQFWQLLSNNGIILMSMPNPESLIRRFETLQKFILRFLPYKILHPKIKSFKKYLFLSKNRPSRKKILALTAKLGYEVIEIQAFSNRESSGAFLWGPSMMFYVLKKTTQNLTVNKVIQ
jgi:2-polyprenyl-3-methyl-5-hydroxy-6-metoxy-1,4-benzoquinol methylase